MLALFFLGCRSSAPSFAPRAAILYINSQNDNFLKTIDPFWQKFLRFIPKAGIRFHHWIFEVCEKT
jgi:hypothetical protein